MNDNLSATVEISKHNMDGVPKPDDSRSLLPTDDQLDQYVDSLCENLPILQLGSSPNSSVTSKSYESDSSNSAQTATHQRGPVVTCLEKSHVDAAIVRDTTIPAFSSDQPKFVGTRRSGSNNNLNVSIIQCTRSLELLVERRSNLEKLIRRQQNFTNCSYNAAYTPRLPDAPTRVDRLLFDINQERGRIVSLTSELEKTINSYSSKTAKDDVRKLLVAYGNAIMDVIKERQNEINSLNGCGDSGVHKLVELVDQVHCMNRHVHTAMWCLEVMEQFSMAMTRRRGAESSSPLTSTAVASTAAAAVALLERKPPGADSGPASPILAPRQSPTPSRSWQPSKVAVAGLVGQRSPHMSPRMPRAAPGGQKGAAAGRPALQLAANPFRVLSPPMRAKKSSALQLIAQQQRAEIFQRFSAPLKQHSLGV